MPTKVTEVRNFLGLAGYYRKFIENFSTIATPLTQLIRNDKSLSGLISVNKVFKN